MPELPKDLFASEISMVAQSFLEKYAKKEITEEEVLNEGITEIAKKLKMAMHMIDTGK